VYKRQAHVNPDIPEPIIAIFIKISYSPKSLN